MVIKKFFRFDFILLHRVLDFYLVGLIISKYINFVLYNFHYMVIPNKNR